MRHGQHINAQSISLLKMTGCVRCAGRWRHQACDKHIHAEAHQNVAQFTKACLTNTQQQHLHTIIEPVAVHKTHLRSFFDWLLQASYLLGTRRCSPSHAAAPALLPVSPPCCKLPASTQPVAPRPPTRPMQLLPPGLIQPAYKHSATNPAQVLYKYPGTAVQAPGRCRPIPGPLHPQTAAPSLLETCRQLPSPAAAALLASSRLPELLPVRRCSAGLQLPGQRVQLQMPRAWFAAEHGSRGNTITCLQRHV